MSENINTMNWVDDKRPNEEWKQSSNFFTERMRTLCHRLFFENPEGAEWLRMMEYQYMTNPHKNININHENMLVEEGIKIVIRSCIENALAFENLQDDKQKAYKKDLKNVRRGRR